MSRPVYKAKVWMPLPLTRQNAGLCTHKYSLYINVSIIIMSQVTQSSVIHCAAWCDVIQVNHNAVTPELTPHRSQSQCKMCFDPTNTSVLARHYIKTPALARSPYSQNSSIETFLNNTRSALSSFDTQWMAEKSQKRTHDVSTQTLSSTAARHYWWK